MSVSFRRLVTRLSVFWSYFFFPLDLSLILEWFRVLSRYAIHGGLWLRWKSSESHIGSTAQSSPRLSYRVRLSDSIHILILLKGKQN